MNAADRLQARSLLIDELFLAKSQLEHQVAQLQKENAELKKRVALPSPMGLLARLLRRLRLRPQQRRR